MQPEHFVSRALALAVGAWQPPKTILSITGRRANKATALLVDFAINHAIKLSTVLSLHDPYTSVSVDTCSAGAPQALSQAEPLGPAGLPEPDPGAVLALACHCVLVDCDLKVR